MEAYEKLLDTWLSLVEDTDSFPTSLIQPQAAKVFSSYMMCHLSPPHGNRLKVSAAFLCLPRFFVVFFLVEQLTASVRRLSCPWGVGGGRGDVGKRGKRTASRQAVKQACRQVAGRERERERDKEKNLVVVVAFCWCARILGEYSTIYPPCAFFFFLSGG